MVNGYVGYDPCDTGLQHKGLDLAIKKQQSIFFKIKKKGGRALGMAALKNEKMKRG